MGNWADLLVVENALVEVGGWWWGDVLMWKSVRGFRMNDWSARGGGVVSHS